MNVFYLITFQFTKMKPKSLLAILLLISGGLFFGACNSAEKPADEKTTESTETAKDQPEVHGTEIKAGDVQLATPLNQQWVTSG